MFQKSVFPILVAILLLTCLNQSSHAQATITKHNFDFGTGVGLDYGGIFGVKMAVIMPWPYVSVFGSAGIQLVGFAWNMGATFHIVPETSKSVFRPNIKLMYGVNRVTKVTGTTKYDKMFTGFTPGLGLEFMFGRKKANGFDFDLNIPIQGKAFYDQVQKMKDDPEVGTVSMMPVAFSIGFHHEF
ncbi:MAG: hypothetical protein HXX13_17290 [Bacteroidetes bacterium]|nr:hypothetical protein [Bacteroidota bacterium]